MSVRLDITSLLADPRRSGIQRVERALIRFWPGGQPPLCRFDPASRTMRDVPPEAGAILAADTPPGGLAAEAAALAHASSRPAPASRDDAPLLCAELFDDDARARFYAQAGNGAHWLVYDFLPWLRPELFPAGPALRLMPYLRALRSVRRGYISAAAKRDAQTRILHADCPGPVLPLGADGLGLEPQHFHPERRDIVLLGTVERRKNVLAAIAAFRTLWAAQCDARLVVVGAIEPDALDERSAFAALAGEPRLRVLGSLPDAALRHVMRGARALLFPSGAEGYGLPPVEALRCGIPVIAAADLPALEGLPPHGQIRLGALDPPSIADAVRALLDDRFAADLWQAAALIELGTWSGFARAVAQWIAADARRP